MRVQSAQVEIVGARIVGIAEQARLARLAAFGFGLWRAPAKLAAFPKGLPREVVAPRELATERLLFVVTSTHGDGDPPDDLRPLLDLVALGTVCDMVPLTGPTPTMSIVRWVPGATAAGHSTSAPIE